MMQPTRQYVLVRGDLLTELLQDRVELDAIYAWSELTIADCRAGWLARAVDWVLRGGRTLFQPFPRHVSL
jgi:hypothetical protein